jgi:hypothetical protein
MTRSWNPDELKEIGAAAELSVAPRRPDGTLRPATTIWGSPHRRRPVRPLLSRPLRASPAGRNMARPRRRSAPGLRLVAQASSRA